MLIDQSREDAQSKIKRKNYKTLSEKMIDSSRFANWKSVYCTIVIFLVYLSDSSICGFCDGKTLKSVFVPSPFRNFLRPVCFAGIIACNSLQAPASIFALDETTTLQEQLSVVEDSQIKEQITHLDLQRKFDTSLRPDFQSGSQVAKAVIEIAAADGLTTQFPLGITSPETGDAKYTESTAVICTAIGKEGPPVAARKFHITNTPFPIFVELNTEDLLFPYTKDAWISSPLNKDNTAMTCVLDTDGKLQTASITDRYGFAISDPIIENDVLRRNEAEISLKSQPSGMPYTDSELAILKNLDEELESKGFRELPNIPIPTEVENNPKTAPDSTR